MRMLLALLSVCALAACEPTVEEPVASSEAQRVGEATVSMLADMASVAMDNAGDCDAIGDGLSTVLSRNEWLLSAGAEHAYELELHYRDRAVAAMNQMMPVLDTCAEHPVVRAVITTMLEGDQ